VDVAESLALQVAQGPLKLAALLPDHVRAEAPIGTRLVALFADTFGHIEDDRDRQHVVAPRELDQRLSCLWLNVRRINDGQESALESLRPNEMEGLERRRRRRLVVLIVRNQAPTEVR
jgi:hypothetical protein